MPRLKTSVLIMSATAVAVLLMVELWSPRTTVRASNSAMSNISNQSSSWLADMNQALVLAATKHKDVLVVFGDSEPSPQWLSMDQALSSRRFLDEASKRFVLVCFPGGGSQSPAALTTRAIWAEKLGVTSLPSAYLIDEKGRAAGFTSARSGDPEQLLQLFSQLAETKARRDVSFAAAASAQGMDKAKLLDEGLQLVGDCMNTGYLDVMTQIVSLDPNNTAGLRERYRGMVSQANIDAAIQAEVYPLIDQHQFLAAVDRINRLIEQQMPTASQKQMLLAFQGQLYQSQGDRPQAIACLDRALAIDLNSAAAQRIQMARASLLEEQQQTITN